MSAHICLPAVYSVDVPSASLVISVVQTCGMHLSSPTLSYLLLLHESSTSVFPCQGLILSAFLYATFPICPFWQGRHALFLTNSLPSPHCLHCLLSQHTEGRFPQLFPEDSVPYLPFLLTLSFHRPLFSTHQLHFPLTFLPSPLICFKLIKKVLIFLN